MAKLDWHIPRRPPLELQLSVPSGALPLDRGGFAAAEVEVEPSDGLVRIDGEVVRPDLASIQAAVRTEVETAVERLAREAQRQLVPQAPPVAPVDPRPAAAPKRHSVVTSDQLVAAYADLVQLTEHRPTRAELAAKLSISARTAARAIARLRASGQSWPPVVRS